jgi:hypothetical protein
VGEVLRVVWENAQFVLCERARASMRPTQCGGGTRKTVAVGGARADMGEGAIAGARRERRESERTGQRNESEGGRVSGGESEWEWPGAN